MCPRRPQGKGLLAAAGALSLLVVRHNVAAAAQCSNGCAPGVVNITTPMPLGDYRQSCRNCTASNHILSCICRRAGDSSNTSARVPARNLTGEWTMVGRDVDDTWSGGVFLLQSDINTTKFTLTCIDNGRNGVCDPWKQRPMSYPSQVVGWHTGNGTVNATSGQHAVTMQLSNYSLYAGYFDANFSTVNFTLKNRSTWHPGAGDGGDALATAPPPSPSPSPSPPPPIHMVWRRLNRTQAGLPDRPPPPGSSRLPPPCHPCSAAPADVCSPRR